MVASLASAIAQHVYVPRDVGAGFRACAGHAVGLGLANPRHYAEREPVAVERHRLPCIRCLGCAVLMADLAFLFQAVYLMKYSTKVVLANVVISAMLVITAVLIFLAVAR